VVRAERGFVDGQSTLVVLLGDVVAPMCPIGRGQVVEAGSHLGMVDPKLQLDGLHRLPTHLGGAGKLTFRVKLGRLVAQCFPLQLLGPRRQACAQRQ